MTLFLLMVLAYFMGAIPSGVWLGKIFKNIDVRDYGSKNSGATNSYRVLGAKLGTTVLIMDVLKGFLPLYIASKFDLEYNDLVLIGLVAILAHTYSCFISFRGGKGVATSLGVFLFLIPVITLILLAIFIVIVYFTRYISLGSITAAFLLPIFMGVQYLRKNMENFFLVLELLEQHQDPLFLKLTSAVQAEREN